MRFKSTQHGVKGVGLSRALFEGFAPDGGLYLPETLPSLTPKEIDKLRGLSLAETSREIAGRLFGDDLAPADLEEIVDASLDLPVPLLSFHDHVHVLELFHGPTFSFKDFGARFMAHLVKRLLPQDQEIDVLVATTGDTGSAVGMAFCGIPRTRVHILYPKGKVTPSQEKQITTIGHNVTALEIEGSFDDCQRLLKTALGDQELRKKSLLTTGNSINVGRLLPQTFYFFNAYGQLPKQDKSVVMAIPCGNFGHLVSGILAKRMGLPVARFVAGTNINDEVPLFIRSGIFKPHPSLPTIAVSMDVGNPSNFPRFTELYQNNLTKIREEVIGMYFTDEEIRAGIVDMHERAGYILDPHSAVSYQSLRGYLTLEKHTHEGIFFATAHPAKFAEKVQPLIREKIPFPPELESCLNRPKKSLVLSNTYPDFREYLTQCLV